MTDHRPNSSLQQTGMVFIGLGVGQCAAVATQPYFNRLVSSKPYLFSPDSLSRKYKVVSTKHNGKPPPEERLKQGCWGAILCPLGLILMGLLSFKNVPWILPILATTLFGAGMIYSFNSTFTYLVEYANHLASLLTHHSWSNIARTVPLLRRHLRQTPFFEGCLPLAFRCEYKFGSVILL